MANSTGRSNGRSREPMNNPGYVRSRSQCHDILYRCVKDVLAQPVKDVMALYTSGASHIPEVRATRGKQHWQVEWPQ